MSSTQIIPFGKYKGQPIEVAQQDHQYFEWLQSQTWFRQKFPSLTTLIINNQNAPSETPEHNAIQAKFANLDFCHQFLLFARHDDLTRTIAKEQILTYDTCLSAPKKRVSYLGDRRISSLDQIRKQYHGDNTHTIEVNEQQVITKMPLQFPERARLHCLNLDFEKEGIDVVMWYGVHFHDPSFVNDRSFEPLTIEIKPNLSDDYPAVLRQMNKNKSQYLLTQSYDGEGATLNEVRFMFECSRKTIVLLSDIL